MVTRRRIRRLLAAAALLLLAAPPARAADIIRLFGHEEVGTAGAVFLRVPVGARAVAMGQAYTSLATDGSALFWNPAGIMRTPGRTNWFASHTEYTADIDLHHLSVHHRKQNFGFGLMMGVLRSGDILRTDELHQEGTGLYFNANQFYLGASLARAMTDRFSIGGTIKYFQENLDEFQTKTVTADLGILYFLGLGDLRVGFAVRNFGPEMRPGGSPPPIGGGVEAADTFQKFPAPTVGSFGAARTWALGREVDLLTAADFNHPSDYAESFRLGAELGLRDLLYLRGGYETSRDEGGASAGFGLRLERKQFLVRIDYAYSDMGTFGEIHRFSVDLSPLTRSKYQPAWERTTP
jgi:hypothetical protein